MSSTTLTPVSAYPALSCAEEGSLCVAFFGLSLYKNGRDDDLSAGKQRVKRAKIAPSCSLRVPHSSILQCRTSHAPRRTPVVSSAPAVDDKMDVDAPSSVSLKRSAPDDDRMDVDAPPLKRVKAPFFLCDCTLVNNGPLATVTFTELVVVFNKCDGLSDAQKAGLDRWNARCTDGHLSEHAPAAVRAPVTVTIKITELIYKPYEELGEDAKRAWDVWNAKCEAEGPSFFGKGEKVLGKRRAVEPLVDVKNVGGRGGCKVQQKNKGRRENAPYALSSRTWRDLLLEILLGVTTPVGAWLLSNIACLILGHCPYGRFKSDTAGRDDPGGCLTGHSPYYAGYVLDVVLGSIACLDNPTALTTAATG
ncbi:hypothetical protein C8R46DRAFT_1294092 [Mycena filopes]|nr:hypothetical protein C8R46DRAFT_1294092 [Mycena filopes]